MSAAEMVEDFDLTAERRKNLDAKAAKEGILVDSVRLGCGTCALWKTQGGQEEGATPSLRDVVSFHEKNIEYLERLLPSFRTRVLGGDLSLRHAVIDFDGGRNLPRVMFSPTAQREGSLFLHILLQSALLDRLASIVTGSSSDDQQQHLSTLLKNDAASLKQFYDIQWNWPETIRRTAQAVTDEVQHEDLSCAGGCSGTTSDAVASLLVSMTNEYSQNALSAIYSNLGLASLGLAALVEAAEQNVSLGDNVNLYSLLL